MNDTFDGLLLGARWGEIALPLSRRQRRRLFKACRAKRHSANLIIDIGNCTDFRASIMIGSGVNFTVGEIVDLQNADTITNVWCAGGVGGGSGAIEIRVQTSPDTTSGNFTDPTSGLAALYPDVASGGIMFFNSGLYGSGNQGGFTAPVATAPLFCSGGIDFAAFQRPGRYARLVNNSGPFLGAITAGFVAQKRTTGSGGGTTMSPGSGAVNV